jgi:hypothetical protein
MDIKDIPPDIIDLMAQAGMLPARMAQAQWSRSHGLEHENTPMPEGRTPQHGYQAANPMEIAAAVLKRREGRDEVADSQRAMAGMLRQQQDVWKKSITGDVADARGSQYGTDYADPGSGTPAPYQGSTPEPVGNYGPTSHDPAPVAPPAAGPPKPKVGQVIPAPFPFPYNPANVARDTQFNPFSPNGSAKLPWE